MRVDRYMYILIEVLTRINHDTYMSSPASASCANRTDQKGRKKEEKKKGACGPQMQIDCK